MGLVKKGRNWNRKGAQVEKLIDKRTKREAVIRLEKGHSMTFYCEIGDLLFESKDGGEVKEWAKKEIAKTTSDIILDWRPVLEVQVKEREYYYSSKRERSGTLTVEADRYYVALTLDKKRWLKLHWEAADPESPAKIDDREMFAAAQDFELGPKGEKDWHGDKPWALPSFNGSTYYLAYSPEVWAGIGEVLAALARQKVILEQLLGTKQGLAQLAQVGLGTQPLRLTAGEEVAP